MIGTLIIGLIYGVAAIVARARGDHVFAGVCAGVALFSVVVWGLQ